MVSRLTITPGSLQSINQSIHILLGHGAGLGRCHTGVRLHLHMRHGLLRVLRQGVVVKVIMRGDRVSHLNVAAAVEGALLSLSSSSRGSEVGVVDTLQSEVRVHRLGPEQGAHKEEEEQGGAFAEDVRDVDVLVSNHRRQEEDDNAREINVDNYHEIEGSEVLQTLERCSKAAITLGLALEMADGPDNRDNYKDAAKHVHKVEDVLPRDPSESAGRGDVDVYPSNVHQQLHYQDREDDLLVAIREEGLEVGPTRADECDDGEHEEASDGVEDIKGNGPSVVGSFTLECVEFESLKEEGRDLEHEHNSHEDVDGLDIFALLDQQRGPSDELDEAECGEYSVYSNKGLLAHGEEVTVAGRVHVPLLHEKREGGGGGGHAVGEVDVIVARNGNLLLEHGFLPRGDGLQVDDVSVLRPQLLVETLGSARA